LKFSEVTEKFCNDFKDYLLTTKTNRSDKRTLSQNSVVSYFNKLKATLKQAYKDGLIPENINGRIATVKPVEVQRKFLTLQELNKLAKTVCTIPVLKQAALFSALTGLRFSDIEKLIWNEIEFIKGQGYIIHFMQKKTKQIEYLPINKQAYELLGKKGKSQSKIFGGLKYSAWTNNHLTKWLIKAGITKEISFHAFRHTFATLQLSKGTDIYTVSKLLGHRELKTTQIYAKVIDKTKRDASNKIKLKKIFI
jgi:integrase